MRLLAVGFLVFLAFVDAQYDPVISSSWSMWSPWSFCSNNVMIRVRACSTVRGYKCHGHNKEFQTCNSPPPRRNNLDYEDFETADRELAMRQLYQDYEPETPDEATTRSNRNLYYISSTHPTIPPEFPSEHVTFDANEYPKEFPVTSTTAEEPTTTTTTTTTTTSTTTEAPTTTTPITTTTEVATPMVETFKGDWANVEEVTPELSVPTSFPIEESEEVVPSESVHSLGSFAIGKEPEAIIEPLVEFAHPSLPTFSIKPSGDLLSVDEIPEEVNTHIELPTEMFMPITTPATTTTTTTTTIPPTPTPTEYVGYPKIALITAQQNFQHFPTMMNEQRAYPRRNVPTPTSNPVLTVEITNKPQRPKKTKKKIVTRRLKKLNRLAKKQKVVAVIPTEMAMIDEEPEAMKVSEIPSWASDKDRKMIEETRELEARLAALRHRVETNKHLLATITPATIPTTTTPESSRHIQSGSVGMEEDTARALSWMINDMERQVSEGGYTLGDITTVSPFPFPVGEGFSLIRTRRSTNYEDDRRILWSTWSDWTNCNCGKQSRKRKCLKRLGESHQNIEEAEPNFIPIGNDVTNTKFGEPAPYPNSVPEPVNRIRKSSKCPEPEIETKLCFSFECHF